MVFGKSRFVAFASKNKGECIAFILFADFGNNTKNCIFKRCNLSQCFALCLSTALCSMFTITDRLSLSQGLHNRSDLCMIVVMCAIFIALSGLCVIVLGRF